jgi:tRNA pseudouridine55 synthase
VLHGILILDKPANVSSAFVVDKVRKRAGVAKAGHTGTLDPLATGVLPVCLGAACKLAGYLIAEDKAYEAELELGRRTDTLDRTGVTLEEQYEAADRVTEGAIEAALAKQRGALEQMPPMYSAIKQDGIRLYQRARAGEEVTRAPRSVVIHRLELRWKRGRKVGLAVHCSKGTFVRSLVDDLGRELGCGASLTELRRTLCGSYSLAQAIALESLTPELAAAHLIPLSRMLAVPSIVVPQRRHGELRDGRPEVLREYAGELQGMAQLVSEAGEMLALIEGRAGRPRYVRVFLESLRLGLPEAAAAADAAADAAAGLGSMGDEGGGAELGGAVERDQGGGVDGSEPGGCGEVGGAAGA